MMKMRFYIGGAPSFRLDLDAVPFDPVGAWGRFIAEYTTRFAPIKQHINQIINDPDATETEKANAKQDRTLQERYLQIISDMYAEILETGVVPNPVVFTQQNANSGLYKWSVDNKIYVADINFPLPEQLVTETWTFVTSEHFDIKMSLPVRGNDTNTMTPFGSLNPPGTITGDWGVKQGSGSWASTWKVRFEDAKGNLTAKEWTFDYTTSQNYAPTMKTSGTIPTVTSGSQIPCGNRQTGVPGFICGELTTVALPGASVSDPWDYYNDYILTQITTTTNAVFPNGYTP